MSFVCLKTLNYLAARNHNNVSPLIRRKYLLALVTNRWVTGGKTSKTTEEIFNEPLGKSYHPDFMEKPPKPPRTVRDFAEAHKNKNWVAYGFDKMDRDNDSFMFHVYMACVVTMICTAFPFIMWYSPDWKLRDWSGREAYLLIAKREKLGLPLVDKELVDPSQLVLPTEEEMEGFHVFL